MDAEKRIDLIVKILTIGATLWTIAVGISEFNQNKAAELDLRKYELVKMHRQDSLETLAKYRQATIETLTKFKNKQSKVYDEATEVISYLTTHLNFKSEEYKAKDTKFRRLYWVELSAVETQPVEAAMVGFKLALDSLQKSKYPSQSRWQDSVRNRGYQVAVSIRESSKSWSVPNGLKSELAP
ncbi:hypothetical protein MUN81_09335 [Hymenobacter sp. 5317J-9]|uniref:hypothetical protein n=1 Tax=Hymenobacter sp. 5317J-9 TaxID=2932250 RepID=UPI001FD660C7|nr:hypothetical protein [Hymenobacter sp. 5317J-9]UOQ99681.1 hypothetical protein MUN81_09335 [Hymenobacter sp. 5317J-9]